MPKSGKQTGAPRLKARLNRSLVPVPVPVESRLRAGDWSSPQSKLTKIIFGSAVPRNLVPLEH